MYKINEEVIKGFDSITEYMIRFDVQEANDSIKKNGFTGTLDSNKRYLIEAVEVWQSKYDGLIK